MLPPIHPTNVRKIRDPQLDPFLLKGNSYFVALTVPIVLPCIFALITTLLLFLNLDSMFYYILSFCAIILFFISILLSWMRYHELHHFGLKGSMIIDLSYLLEGSMMRIQSLIFPLFFLFFLGSFFVSGFGTSSGNATSSSSLITTIIPIIGILLPLISLYSPFTMFFDYVDDRNNRVLSLSERLPTEEFRTTLKRFGEKLGFNDVKIRLGDLANDDYCSEAWAVSSKGVVFLVYSSITAQKANPTQNLIFCVRELVRLKSNNIRHLIPIVFLRNFVYVLSLSILGALILVLSHASWNQWLGVGETNVPLLAFSAICFFLASFFLKSYYSTNEMFTQLKADDQTVQVLTENSINHSESVQALSSVTKLNPMVLETRGYEYRKNSLARLYSPNLSQEKKGISWDDL